MAIAAFAILALVAFGAVGFLVFRQTSSGSSAAATQDDVVRITNDLNSAQEAASSAERGLDDSKSSFAQARSAGADLRAAVDRARRAVGDLSPSSASDRKLVSDLRSALDADSQLAQGLSDLPASPADLRPSDANDLVGLATAADEAFATLSGALPGVTVAVDRSDLASLPALAKKLSRRRQLAAFVSQMENLLGQSATGRTEIVQAVGDMNNHCASPPDQDAQRVRSVASNRQSVLDQVSAMNVPNLRSAQHIHALFQQALQHSIEADRHFADWMDNLFAYYYTYPVGCPGSVPQDSNYQAAQTESAAATGAKQQLVAAFDPLARSLGQRSDWTEADI